MKRQFLGVLILAGLLAATVGGMAAGTPQMGVTSNPLAPIGSIGEIDVKTKTGDWKIHLTTKGDSAVQVVENTVVPGGTFGWHGHPGPSLVVVKSGTATEYLGEDPCTPIEHKVGEAFVDPGGPGHIHLVRNESITEDLVVVVTRLAPPNVPLRSDAPDPGCPPEAA